jgi:A/G-specific adenine glycosylase
MQRPKHLRRLLLEWYAAARRDLPWRRTRDPWKILVSEVMLQQTRVAAVIPFYERFVARYPDAQSLADAPEQELLALWAGLGYYSRARNLQRAARIIAARGGFPSTYEEIRELPGVGDYTAAAVASICFDLPHAVLDGNVMRVLARYSAEPGDVRSGAVRSRLKEFAQHLLDPGNAADFNQAIMELGATVCLPKDPQCLFCPWRDSCEARARGIQRELPVKLAKRDPVKLAVRLLLVERAATLLLRQRDAAESRLAGFWELPEARDVPTAKLLDRLGSFRHSITRHDYEVEVWSARVSKAPSGYKWFAWSELGGLPLSTMARKALAAAGRPTGYAALGAGV